MINLEKVALWSAGRCARTFGYKSVNDFINAGYRGEAHKSWYMSQGRKLFAVYVPLHDETAVAMEKLYYYCKNWQTDYWQCTL